MKEKIIKIFYFIRRFSKEIFIGLIFAVIVALGIDYVRDKFKENNLRNDLKAVAVVVTYDKDGNLLNQGSGFFITSTGILVTNYHVIQVANLAHTKAKLPSGAYYDLKEIIGIDETSDIAILQFDAQETPFIKKIGNSDKIKTGEKVIAIGAPLGLESSVSEGVISYPKRKVGNTEFIQFTAPISSGSSGGGLFGEGGQVLGVITLSIRKSLEHEIDIQNLNFALPINTVKKVLEGREPRFEGSPAYYYSKGVLAENKHDFDNAEKYYKKTIALNSKLADAYENLGGIYYEKGLYDQEIKYYLKATQLDPNNYEYFYYLATAYEDAGLFDEAINAYKQALKINSENKDSMHDLAILYLATGKKDKASQLLPKLMNLDSGLGKKLELLLKQ